MAGSQYIEIHYVTNHSDYPRWLNCMGHKPLNRLRRHIHCAARNNSTDARLVSLHMSYWPQIDRALWISTTLLQASLLLLIYVKKVFRWSPIFAAYVAGLVVISAAWLGLVAKRLIGLSGIDTWGALHVLQALEAAVEILGVLATAEIGSRIFEEFPNPRCTWRVWRQGILKTFAIFAVVVVCNASIDWVSGTPHVYVSDFYLASEFIPLAGIALIVASVLICRSSRIVLPASEATLLFGFGLHFGLRSLSFVASMAGGSWDTLLWLHIQGWWYLAVLIIWYLAILGDRRIRQKS